jgi:hypothetical protein
MNWIDRLAHKLPSAERLKHITQLADLQKALSETIDMLALITGENVTLMRRGNRDKESVSIMHDRIALLTALQTGRNR